MQNFHLRYQSFDNVFLNIVKIIDFTFEIFISRKIS